MNTGIVVVLLSLGVVCVVLGLLLLSLRRDNARLSDERAAADEARRLAEESRRVSEEKSAAAEIEIRTLVERSTLAQARLEAAEQRMAEARAEREKMEETFRTQFKNLANDILGEQSRTFKETNREALDVLLKPFRDNIVEFRERVEKIYSSENEQRGALRNELERLMELNRRITTETTNLTNALKGNSKVQGDWGEMILETILDNSNLIRGVHYDTQLNIKDEAGNNLRPDVVLYLPEGKRIVIDSKVSLTAFVGYVGADPAPVSCVARRVGAAARRRTGSQGVPAIARFARFRHYVHSQRTGVSGGAAKRQLHLGRCLRQESHHLFADQSFRFTEVGGRSLEAERTE